MTPSDLTRLAKIEARLAEITRAPWYRLGVKGGPSQVLSSGAANGHAPLVGVFEKREDAEFCASAPEDVAWLAAKVRAAAAFREGRI